MPRWNTNLSGDVFGRLLVLERAENSKSNKVRWKCRCICGKETIVQSNHLTSGGVQSCGCYKREKSKSRMLGNELCAGRQNNLKHNKSRSLDYSSWYSMKRRCTDPDYIYYQNYGGRGIKVYYKWLHSFPEFYEYVIKTLGPREKGMQIDRINNDGNYEPNNIRWVYPKENCNNRRARSICDK
jgi:hypothetical protein